MTKEAVKEIRSAIKEVKKRNRRPRVAHNSPYHRSGRVTDVKYVKVETDIKNRIKVPELKENTKYIDFKDALKSFLQGKYVTRSEWKDYYFFKVNEHGNIMISDPKRFGMRPWVPTLDDLTKNDWIVIDNDK